LSTESVAEANISCSVVSFSIKLVELVAWIETALLISRFLTTLLDLCKGGSLSSESLIALGLRITQPHEFQSKRVSHTPEMF